MNTRIYLSVTLFCLTAFLFQGCSKQNQTTLWPAHLQIENRNEPLGIDEKAPRLSWQLMQTDTRLRVLHQFAYQIQVASSNSALLQNKPDMWDTGKVHSEQTHDIVFSGNTLNSNHDYYWRVMVWDQDAHPSAWSQSSHWSMGFLNHDEWKAKWIGLDTPASIQESSRM